MAEPALAYTVASDGETTLEEKSYSLLPEGAIGIDIGTSHCSAAFWNGYGVELFRNTQNQKLMRSYVSFKGQTPSGGVSNLLRDEYEILSGVAIFNFKRLIGRVDTDPVVHASKSLPFLVKTLDIGVRPFIAALVWDKWRSTTPEEALAILLIELRTMAELKLKRPVRKVVVTIPVAFSRFQLARVERACAMAGLRVEKLVPEPSAVALLYVQQQQQQNIHKDLGSVDLKYLVIFNMGAGFCDVAVSDTNGGVSQIKSLAGAAFGGEDILLNTMRHLLPDMDSLFSNHGIEEITRMGSLRVATQDAIHKLSSQSNVRIVVDWGNGRNICKVLDREEFEEVNREIFEKCESLIKQCLHDAKVKIGDIDDVVLVGGCSNIPKLQKIVTGVFKKDPYTGLNPFEAAVRGAALEGAVPYGGKYEIKDFLGSLELLTIQATSLSIGVRADGNSFIPIIHKGISIPTTHDMIFTTVHDNQAEAMITVYEGVDKVVEKNHLLGYFKITGIPPAPKGVPEIKVSLDINVANVLRVFAGVIMPGTKKPAAPVMEIRMPTVDDGLCWSAEALNRIYGSTLDLATVQKNGAP